MENKGNSKDFARKRSVKNSLQLSNLEHGRLPPQAVDLEEAVLGAMMLEKEAVNVAIDILMMISN